MNTSNVNESNSKALKESTFCNQVLLLSLFTLAMVLNEPSGGTLIEFTLVILVALSLPSSASSQVVGIVIETLPGTHELD